MSCRSAIGNAARLGAAIALGGCLTGASPEPPVDEYRVKAAFIYNFAKFVVWPSGAFQNMSEPIAVCVLGLDPFGHLLDETLAGRAIDGRSLIVRRVPTVKQSAGCHILFIGSAQNKRSSGKRSDVTAPGILTIGESDGSVADDPVINFTLEGGKVHFDIDVEAAGRQGLRISSRLLGLAHIIQSTPK